MSQPARRIGRGSSLLALVLLNAVLLLPGCPGGSAEDDDDAVDAGQYAIAAEVTGLAGTLVLDDSGRDTLTVTTDGTHAFATAVASGQAYDVTVATHPDGQECAVDGGSGVATGDVSVDVVCATVAAGYYVGGTVDGLVGTLVLENNDGDPLTVAADGPFRFDTRLADAVDYVVEVRTQPAGQFCTVADGAGTVAGASVTSVTVTCAAASFRLTNRGITTEAPSVVKAAVHVHRVSDGAAVTGLTADDFEVLEDGVAVTPSESFLDLAPIDDVPYVLKTVIAVDVSSSLTVADVAQVKQSLKDLLIDPVTLESRLLPGQQVAIYTFDDTVTLRIDFSSDVPALLAAVDAIVRGGPSTNLYGAIVTGAGRWQDTYALSGIVNGALIVVTDGNDTAGLATKAQAITATTGKQLFAVPVGSEVVLSNLEEIAGADHVVPATDFGQLHTTLATVVDRLSSFSDGLYFLYYATPRRSGTHTVTIGVRDNQNAEPDATISGTFSATGFSNVVPEIVQIGPAEVAYDTSVTWEVRTRWSNDPPNYTWAIPDTGGWLQVTEDGVTADGKGEAATMFATGTGCGVRQVTITDVNRSLTITRALIVNCVPVTNLSLGTNHACAIAVDGATKCWGGNTYSQLGDGTTTTRKTPTTVPGLSGAVQIGTGNVHSCAVIDDGTIKCWGYAETGALGDGTTTGGTAPGGVAVIDSAIAVDGGGSHTCALLADGTVMCWGNNPYGQVGDGTTTTRLTPVAVPDVSNVDQIALGVNRSCVLGGGAIKCWGQTPVAPRTGVAEISDNGFSACIRLLDRTLRCWGSNYYGQLGNGTTNGSTIMPEQTVSGLAGAASVSVGDYHACATLIDGRAMCWGRNDNGQLGNGTTTDSPTPVFVSGLSGAVGVYSGGSSSCALLASGGVRCWGRNSSGQLGDGTTTSRSTPVQALVTIN